jgi:hypothetical protein
MRINLLYFYEEKLDSIVKIKTKPFVLLFHFIWIQVKRYVKNKVFIPEKYWKKYNSEFIHTFEIKASLSKSSFKLFLIIFV